MAGLAFDFPLADVSDHLARPDTIVWVDLREPSKQVLDQLADELGLHELAIEDALNAIHHPKIESYGDYLYLILHGIDFQVMPGEIRVIMGGSDGVAGRGAILDARAPRD